MALCWSSPKLAECCHNAAGLASFIPLPGNGMQWVRVHARLHVLGRRHRNGAAAAAAAKGAITVQEDASAVCVNAS